MDPQHLALVGITLGAAVVNGALGYGFSSITVPLALLFLTNRVLNPALIPLEVALNAYVLWVNRAALPQVWRRVLPIVIGLAPGVALGTALVSQVQPAWLKFGTFVVLLPLILIQAAGYRRPIKSEQSVGFAFGGGVGLYLIGTVIFRNASGISRVMYRYVAAVLAALTGFLGSNVYAALQFTCLILILIGLVLAESKGEPVRELGS